MKQLITLFVVLFSINVIGQIGSNNYQSVVEKITLMQTTYKEATDILGIPENVIVTEREIVAGIELEGNVLYEYSSKGIRLFCKSKDSSAVINEIILESPFKDTLEIGLFIGMKESDALKKCYKYKSTDRYLSYPSPYSDKTNIYFYNVKKYKFSIYSVEAKIVSLWFFTGDTDIEKSRKEKGVENIKKYGEKWGKLVNEGKIKIGMTKQMVRDSWGKPNDIRRSVGSWGVHEQWIYGDYENRVYIYIENDIVTSWQD